VAQYLKAQGFCRQLKTESTCAIVSQSMSLQSARLPDVYPVEIKIGHMISCGKIL